MDDDDYQPIRALNDLLFCERRCALHRVEQVWVDNVYTLEGTSAHRKVHAEPSREEFGTGGRLVRGLRLRSDRLRLCGVADLVEFRTGRPHPSPLPEGEGVAPLGQPLEQGERPQPNPLAEGEGVAPLGQPLEQGERPHPNPLPAGEGVPLDDGVEPRRAGPFAVGVPYPVEYKRGRRRRWDNDDVQLCAQALCLEEMLGVAVPAGAIFHVKSRRRREIAFDAALRSRTEAAVARLHELFASGETPPPVVKPRCRGCSLRELCLPETLAEPARAARYHRSLFATVDEG